VASVRNVVVLSDYAFYKGGAEKIALTSAMALASKGLNVHLFSAVGPVEKELSGNLGGIHCLDQYDILSDTNRLHAITTGIWNYNAGKRLSQLLSSLSPDETVVHAHQWNKALTTSVFMPVKAGGFSFVITLHDYFIACPNGGFLVYPKNEICERVPLSLDCIACNCDVRSYGHKVWRVSRHLVQSKIFGLPRSLKHCIYLSAFSKAILKPYLPADIHWYHVPNPSDFTDVGQVAAAQNHSFLFVGRLSAEKGVTLFAEAARQAGVEAVFVGDGAEKDAILSVNPHAIITGWISHAEVLARFRSARALVFPSLCYEGQPLAVLEALSLGVPIIVTDRCAASEAVIDGHSGLHFQRGNLRDLIDKITLMGDDAVVSCLSAQAYGHARANFYRMDDHVEQLIDVYQRMLS
jgi:glycosyltransferase involved in cell wall biosynthesis